MIEGWGLRSARPPSIGLSIHSNSSITGSPRASSLPSRRATSSVCASTAQHGVSRRRAPPFGALRPARELVTPSITVGSAAAGRASRLTSFERSPPRNFMSRFRAPNLVLLPATQLGLSAWSPAPPNLRSSLHRSAGRVGLPRSSPNRVACLWLASLTIRSSRRAARCAAGRTPRHRGFAAVGSQVRMMAVSSGHRRPAARG